MSSDLGGVSGKELPAGKIKHYKTRTGIERQCEFMQGFKGHLVCVDNGEEREPALAVKAF